MHLIKFMQVQACFKQQLPGLQPVLLPPEGGVSGRGFDEASAEGACGGSGTTGTVSAGESTVLTLALSEGTGTNAVLVANLLDKGLAAGRPPEQDFLRIFS